MGIVPPAELFPLAVEFVGEALEEEQAEDEFLEFGGIHLTAQDVGGLEEEGLQLRQGYFFSSQRFPSFQAAQYGTNSE